ncbi:hypothetical protein N7532_008287 [Penicillium argentinense]|uniref:Rhodopsin domain-containing protein n=1 Tax=Penicillium argentinense TaxID=1131581 RepID=A0A9W9EX22_9EURO|nr:uncharacterized protein N7532_008287 [Penicillium argentinense]KAJ5089603.1 hypothetical protein N7532_008287 [Penicillium argentinense]
MTVAHPDDVYHTLNLVVQCLCIPIVSGAVALRFYTRFRFKQNLGIEDYACIVAWLLFMGYCGVSILVGRHGGGYHIGDLSPEMAIQFKKFCYIATLLYCPMALFVKIALLSILTRIFAPYRSKVWFIYILLGALCIYYSIALIIKIRICYPIPYYWLGEELEGGGTCLDQAAALIADSVISVVSDIIILVLPLPLTWSLQMSRNKKLRVIGLLGAGGFAVGFSLYRLVLVLKDGSSPDQSIVFMCVILSGNAEGGVGLICACLPVLNSLLAHYKRNYSSQKYYNQSSDFQLGDRKSGGTSKNNSQWDKSPNFGDQSHLISFAGAPEATDSVYNDDGIRKTVAVEQTVESRDSDSR